jgi:hypothetical protein
LPVTNRNDADRSKGNRTAAHLDSGQSLTQYDQGSHGCHNRAARSYH